MKTLQQRYCLAALTVSAFIASAALAQDLQRPQPRPLDPRLPDRDVELRLPNFIGEGTEASRVWITPELVTTSMERDPPGDMEATDFPDIMLPSDDDDGTSGTGEELPRLNLPLPFPGGGEVARPDYIPAVLGDIIVVNPNRYAVAEVYSECHNREGVRLPGFTRRATVNARSIEQWRPAHYRGRGDGLGFLPYRFWCVISASAPVYAHARTAEGQYVMFFIGAE